MPRQPTLTFDRGTLILHPPPRGKGWIDFATWDDRIERFRIPALQYRSLVESLRREETEFADRAKGFEALPLEAQPQRKPYRHQSEALAAWRQAGGRGVVVLPTGSGKTYLAHLALQAIARHTLVVVPTLDLMHQWYEQLVAAFPTIEIGLLGGGSRDRSPILVATYDSAAIHAETLGGAYGLIVFDECHHLPSDFNRAIAEYAIAPYRLGLSATPERADGRHADLDDLIGPQVYRKSADDLAGSTLADYEVVQIKVQLSVAERDRYQTLINSRNEFLQQANIRLGYLEGWQQFVRASARSPAGRRAMLAHREAKQIALGTAGKLQTLAELVERHADERVLIFTNDNATVYRISCDFLIPAITHQTPVKERHAILEAFRNGTYRTLVVSHVLNEGVDVPEVKVAVLLSGTGSAREYIQRLGRILRKAKTPGKSAILYEVVAEGTVEERTSERRRGQGRSPRQLEIVPQRTTPRAAEAPAEWNIDDLPF
ncbi:DEAD/DEAH box helicase [Synechococcus sp. PCC 7336]|uniref:DEAD/DEAH box helicase n=1 Tax=Synechococcus sp. PCC 7336 TaxID=195250 RepID=UPI00034C6CCA|nr:DEAD/DEAH box helicase family protein [Synechococcus sp. PCC 7336]